jgi:hypothetical protein
MTRQTRIPKWISLGIGYFALTGLALHLALGGIYLKRPDIILKAKEIASSQIEERLDIGFHTPGNSAQIPWEDVRRQFPEWRPLSTPDSAPDAQSMRIGARIFRSVNDALSALQPGETLDIGTGIYDTPLVVRADNVTILGHGHVVLENGTAEGKGNMVIKSNGVNVRNLECRQISVPDGNGACIRLEGENLFVDHVYFHDSQQGILTGSDPGLVQLRDSRFERLGAHGSAHGIYIGGGQLLVEDSLFLAAQDQGHEIKTRAHTSKIVRSVIASLNGQDSRLIDASNGGNLIVEGSVLAQGPNSSNADMIGFALEARQQAPVSDHAILRNNLILMERNGPNQLLHLGNEKAQVEVVDNLIISAQDTGYESGNIVFKTREEAGFPKYPALLLERFWQSHPARQTRSGP